MQTGDTFLDDSDPDGHLYIVASDPTADAARVVVVNLTSLKHKSDTTCILYPGDHPWVKVPTVVYYRMARVHTLVALNAKQASGTIHLQRRLGANPLQRVQVGFAVSDQAPMDCYDVLTDQGLC